MRKRWMSAVADLLLPVPCVACGGVEGPLCPVCARHALHTVPLPVPADARPGGAEPEVCVAAGAYRGALRSALIAYKERGRRALAGALGARLAAAVSLALKLAGVGGPCLLVPVPSSAAAVRSRGGDHLVRLAREAAVTLRQGGREVRVASVLTMRRTPADSVGLGAAARRANVHGAFGVRARAVGLGRRGASIVLVDDIVTTGATLAESCRAATLTGLPVLAAATVAATPPRGGPRSLGRHAK